MKLKIGIVIVAIVLVVAVVTVAAPKQADASNTLPQGTAEPIETEPAGVLPQGVNAPRQLSFTSKEDAIAGYISYLKDGNQRAIVAATNYIMCSIPGEDPDDSWHEVYQPAELSAEEMNQIVMKAIEERAKNAAKIAYNQAEFMCELFGADVWDNISYTLEKWIPISGDDRYVDVKTGKEISADEYANSFRIFWEGVAKEEGVTYEDLFPADPAKADGPAARTDIIWEHIEECPVALLSVGSSEAYKVHLTFDGVAETEDYGDFKFTVEGKDDIWIVSGGLEWEILTEETGDI